MYITQKNVYTQRLPSYYLSFIAKSKENDRKQNVLYVCLVLQEKCVCTPGVDFAVFFYDVSYFLLYI